MTERGLIIHYGPYSVPAFDSVASARRRKTKNGSEWYLKRLMDFKSGATYRPTAGYAETGKYHEEKYKDIEYHEFAKQLCITRTKEWCEFARDIKCSYIILTYKHHDGYCLPDQMVQDFKKNATDCGLKFGLYYSWYEFEHQSCTIDYWNRTVVPQVTKILNEFNPDIWWFDGDWVCKTKYVKNSTDQLIRMIRDRNPNVIINSRFSGNTEIPSYYCNADRTFNQTGKSWEYIDTVGFSWGRNREQKESDYKSAQELYQLYNDVCKIGNGRFLINIGPNYDGEIDPFERRILQDFSRML
jgi:alpha-L-fucosidase